MMRRTLSALPVLLLLLILSLDLSVPTLKAALVWRPGEGWADEKGGDDISASSSKDQLELSKKLEEKGNLDDAYKAYKGLVRKWPLSFSSPEAQFKIGWIESKKGDFWKSFKSYQRMVEKYPNSGFFDQALEQEFMIGNLYLSGEPQRVLKIPIPTSMARTEEIFEAIIKAAPYGKYAPQAQFKIGLAREKQKKFSEAIKSYNELIAKYPGNDIVDDAQYQIGYAWMMAASEPDYDQSAAQKAVEAFQEFLVRYPNSEKAAQAADNIKRLNGRETEGAMNIAKFYEAQKNLKAAYIYYNEVVRQNPDSPQAEVAKKKIVQLRPYAESQLATAATPKAALPINAPIPSSGPAAPPSLLNPSNPPSVPVASNNGVPSQSSGPSGPPPDSPSHPENEPLPR